MSKHRKRTPEVSSSAAPAERLVPRRWRPRGLLLSLLVLGGFTGAGVVWVLARDGAPPVYGFSIVKKYPHDPKAYTQGLVIAGGSLFESTGKFGESTLRRVDLESGAVQQSRPLKHDFFGEGLAAWDEQLIQLTWKNNTALVYDRRTLRAVREFSYEGEGWGLTTDGKHLIMSDGSATLTFLDPRTFQVVRRLLVRSQGRRVDELNELEYVRGEIYANIWYKDFIARISPQSGEVTSWIDLRGLWPERNNPDAVLNGIAFDAEHSRLFVTGKNWPHLYEIRLTRQ